MDNKYTKTKEQMNSNIFTQATLVAKYTLSYVKFFWGISWRSLALSLLMAIIIGITLGIMVNYEIIPSESMQPLATMLASPMTLAIVLGVIFIRIREIAA